MGRTITPTYRLEISGRNAQTSPMSWQFGKPTVENLESWIHQYIQSLSIGGGESAYQSSAWLYSDSGFRTHRPAIDGRSSRNVESADVYGALVHNPQVHAVMRRRRILCTV
jgi:hypothetical protein